MAKFARAICTLHTDTGLLEDRVVNVMHFDGDDSQTWAEDADDLAGRIHTFYAAIDGSLGATLNGTLEVQIYDLAEPEPRVPKYEQTWTDLVPAATSLPTEVALCISFAAAAESGQSQARRRGRVYIGPHAVADNVIIDGRVRPSTGLINLLGDSFRDLVIGPDPGDFRLAVFSPTTLAAPGGTLAAAFNDVATIWIDNAWDTQRRRGTDATARTFFVPS